jgi:hypothetical protein
MIATKLNIYRYATLILIYTITTKTSKYQMKWIYLYSFLILYFTIIIYHSLEFCWWAYLKKEKREIRNFIHSDDDDDDTRRRISIFVIF